MKRVILACLLLSLVGGAVFVFASIPRAKPRASVGDIDPKKLFRPRQGSAIDPAIALRDEAGRSVTMGDFGKDRPFFVVPVYFKCPSLCNEVINDLAKALRGVAAYQAGRDYDVLLCSFEPKETPELAARKKEAYVEAGELPPGGAGWHFLTGDADNVSRLLDAVGYRIEWDERRKEYAHAAGIVICSPDGTIARYFPGLGYRPLYIRLALNEAGKGKITPQLMDQVLMPCFAFDETKGEYTAAVMFIVRAAGLLMLATIVGGWLVLARSGRRPATAFEAAAP